MIFCEFFLETFWDKWKMKSSSNNSWNKRNWVLCWNLPGLRPWPLDKLFPFDLNVFSCGYRFRIKNMSFSWSLVMVITLHWVFSAQFPYFVAYKLLVFPQKWSTGTPINESSQFPFPTHLPYKINFVFDFHRVSHFDLQTVVHTCTSFSFLQIDYPHKAYEKLWRKFSVVWETLVES